MAHNMLHTANTLRIGHKIGAHVYNVFHAVL